VPTDEAFTYQGYLEHDGSAYTGSATFEFSLFDVDMAGVQQGTTLQQILDVDNGVFSTELDFGIEHFTQAQDRFLEIAVDVSGVMTPLSPRQRIAPSSVALFSMRPWETDGNDIFYSGARVGIGTNTPQFRLDVRSTTPRAIYGQVTNPSGATYGIFGQSDSSGGSGVLGWATSDDGVTNGVIGQTSSTEGRGVLCIRPRSA
jgi:hypothetical protein